jgi:hypothetical protein
VSHALLDKPVVDQSSPIREFAKASAPFVPSGNRYRNGSDGLAVLAQSNASDSGRHGQQRGFQTSEIPIRSS